MIVSEVTEDKKIREEIYRRVFPDNKWGQLFFTFLTGCPHQTQKPLHLKPIDYLVFYILCFSTGILSSAWFWNCGWFLLIPVGWFFTLTGVAGFIFGMVHHASHFNISGKKNLDVWLGKIAAILIWMTRFESYQRGHKIHHFPKTHQTEEDNTILILQSMDIKPGLDTDKYWQSLWCLLNPIFICKFSIKRTVGLFVGEIKEVWCAWLFWGLVGAILALTNSWLEFAVAYFIPVFILFTPLYYLRHCIEHKMTSPEIYTKKDREYIGVSTDGVFLGELPPQSNRFSPWVVWWCKMIFWHGAIRFLICTADIPFHCYHTRMAGSPHEDWANALWHRFQQQESGNPGWGIPYTTHVGFVHAINAVFESFSNLPKDFKF